MHSSFRATLSGFPMSLLVRCWMNGSSVGRVWGCIGVVALAILICVLTACHGAAPGPVPSATSSRVGDSASTVSQTGSNRQSPTVASTVSVQVVAVPTEQPVPSPTIAVTVPTATLVTAISVPTELPTATPTVVPQTHDIAPCFALPDDFQDMAVGTRLKVFRGAADCWFTVLEGLQFHGGWAAWYSYPDFRPYDWIYGGWQDYTITNTKFRGWGSTGMLFLHGFRILQEEWLAKAIVRTADMLLATQDDLSNLWHQAYTMKNGEWHAYQPQEFAIEEHAQDTSIYILLFAYSYTGEAKYLESAVRAAEALLHFQDASGGFQLRVLLDPATGENVWNEYYPILLTFNDENLIGPMGAFRAVYEFTREPKYLGGLKRAADFILLTQLPRGPGQGCWAEAYDERLVPAWDRNFEPPSISIRTTRDNLQVLLWLYSMTRDTQYLEAVRRGTECVMRLTSRWPEGARLTWYFSLTNGHLIAAEDYCIYDLENHSDLDSLRAKLNFAGSDEELVDRYGYWNRDMVLNRVGANLDKVLAVRPNDATRTDITERPRPAFPPTLPQVQQEFDDAYTQATALLLKLNDHALRALLGRDGTTQIFDIKERYGREMELVLKAIEYYNVLSGQKPVEQLFQWDGMFLYQLLFPSGYDDSIDRTLWSSLPGVSLEGKQTDLFGNLESPRCQR